MSKTIFRYKPQHSYCVLAAGPFTAILDWGGHNVDLGLHWGRQDHSPKSCCISLRTIPRLIRNAKHHWLYKWRWSPFPVYWDRYSRDCDQLAVEWCERHPNGWTAYSSYCAALDNAEGPEHFNRITKREYEQNKDYCKRRDHAAEQMNY